MNDANPPTRSLRTADGDDYPLTMTVSAHDVAHILRQQLPGVGDKRLHKLLYLCQGHHVAMIGTPLFNEGLLAYDMGPVVARLWADEKAGRSLPPVDLDDSALNTVAFVLSRYGSLSGRDLEILSHGQDPWIQADESRQGGGSDLIALDILSDYFSVAENDDGTPWPDGEVVHAWLRGAEDRLGLKQEPDDIERLRARARD